VQRGQEIVELVEIALTIAFVSLVTLMSVRTRSARTITLVLAAALLSLSLMAPMAQAATDPETPTVQAAARGQQEKNLDPDALGREAIDTARNFAIPLTVALVVIAFLVIQGLVDRRDPRLAHPPATAEEDMVGFE
jgi:hypothetical protein